MGSGGPISLVNIALTPRETKTHPKFIMKSFPLGVVARFRAAFAEKQNPKALRTTTSEVFLPPGTEKAWNARRRRILGSGIGNLA